MKKLFILLIISTTLSISAQEKQNDATWEETIDFISKYINVLNGNFIDVYNITVKQTISLENNTLKVYRVLSRYKEILEVNLNFLTSVKTNGAYMYLYSEPVGKYEQIYYSDSEQNFNSSSSSNSRILILKCLVYDEVTKSCKKDLSKNKLIYFHRLEKAFKHLAYLANQKRKKSKF